MISSRLVLIGFTLACCARLLRFPTIAADGWSRPETFQSLPVITGLPDAFTFADGSRVKSPEDWARRREELKAMLLYYQYGHMPPRPDRVIKIHSEQRPHESGLGTMESMTLEIDSVKKLRFRAVLYLPKHPGRRPVIIREEDRIGQRKDVPLFLEKGYIFIEYARHDLDPDRDRVIGPAQAAYPNHDWATLAVWAWCGMRLVDYLETRSDIDITRIGITGHSRGGKMALLAAALDERISLVVPHQSGSGGAGCYRVLGPGAETLAQNDKPHWYHERIRWFGEKEERLPFDQHFLKALVAPRALLCTESVDDEFANPLGSLATSAAAQEVYTFLGATEKNAIHFRRGRHSTETRDWARILEFAEWQFFGRKPDDRSMFWSAPFDVPEGYASANGPARVECAQDVAASQDPPAVTTFVTVSSPDNQADRDHHGQGRYGAVDHEFQIAVNRVSNRKYADFLAAVASKSDPHALYDPAMAEAEGAIKRVAKESGFDYVVPQTSAQSPVTHVSWFDAIRYCNWLHNGRPNGPPSPATTEDGAYTIHGDQVSPRHNRARFFLPSEDEWYKAAYFDRSGAYHHFAPGESNRPVLDKPAPDRISPWGMAGFAGQVWEWTESPVGALHRAVRSGAWFLGNNKQSAGHFYCNPKLHYFSTGFRIARPVETLGEKVTLGVEEPLRIAVASPPRGLVADAELGLLRHEALQGQVVHVAPKGVRGLFETRAIRTPKGDLLLMFPEGNHYATGAGKVNDLLAYRSSDDGKTWLGPAVAFKIDYSQHGLIPLIPRGSGRIYAFGTQPIPSEYSREKGKFENTPIGFRWSDDDGHSWSDVTLIKPVNDPGFLGMSVMRMCETGSGAWILGSHTADWSKQPLETRQYLLRSDDQGKTWTLLPGKGADGWQTPELNRMDEGRPIWVGGDELFFMARTPTGRLWTSRSFDDGKTWPAPVPSPLVHPDAPPMLFHLSDGKTLIAFIHNRHAGTKYSGLTGTMDGMRDRSEIWVSLSRDGGRQWSEPRFLFANATVPDPLKNGWFNHQVSYIDAVIDRGIIHLFCPHLWKRALHLTIREEALPHLPAAADLKQTSP